MDYSFGTKLNNWSESLKNTAFAISTSRRHLIIFATARAKITAATEREKMSQKWETFSWSWGFYVVSRFRESLKSLKV